MPCWFSPILGFRKTIGNSEGIPLRQKAEDRTGIAVCMTIMHDAQRCRQPVFMRTLYHKMSYRLAHVLILSWATEDSMPQHYVSDDWEEDLFDDIKMGHLSEHDAHVFETMFRLHPPRLAKRPKRDLHHWRRQVTQHRANVIGKSVGYSYAEREVVVKAVSRTKSRAGVRRMVSYIARPREDDGDVRQPQIYNEFGLPLDAEDWRDELDAWRLVSDKQNITEKQRQWDMRGIVRRPDVDGTTDRLRHIQAHHLVFSINRLSNDPIDLKDRLCRAMHGVIDEAFTSKGHKALWALHNDTQDHPHVHVVVKALAEHGERLRFDRQGDYFDYLRLRFAQALCNLGVDCKATRRVDRAQLRRSILMGEAPLKDSWHIRDFKRPIPLLHLRAPRWCADRLRLLHDMQSKDRAANAPSFASLYGYKRNRRSIKSKLRIKMWLKAFPESTYPLAEAIDAMYPDPIAAQASVVSFCEEKQGNTALAAWLIMRRPTYFGDCFPIVRRRPHLRRRLAKEVRKLEKIYDFERYRQRRTSYPMPRLPDESPERLLAEIERQREKAIQSVMRVAYACRSTLADEEAAKRVRVELLADLLDTMQPRRRLMKSGTKKKLLERWAPKVRKEPHPETENYAPTPDVSYKAPALASRRRRMDRGHGY